MGGSDSKISSDLSTGLVINRLSNLMLPEEGREATACMKELDKHFSISGKTNILMKAKELLDCDGIKVLIDAISRIIDDIDSFSIFIQLLDTIKIERAVIMSIIQNSGLSLLERGRLFYASDDYLFYAIPKLTKFILDSGSEFAFNEVESEIIGLQLCDKCHEALKNYQERTGSTAGNLKIQSHKHSHGSSNTLTRVSKILSIMENFIVEERIQVSCYNGLLIFIRNNDAKRLCEKIEILSVMILSVKQYPKNPMIIWRAAMVLSKIASFSKSQAIKIMEKGFLEIFIENFKYFCYYKLVRQEILWLLSSLLLWDSTQKSIQASKFFVGFLREFFSGKYDDDKLEEDEEDEKIDAFVVRIEDDPLLCGGHVIVPINIIKFMRETKGKVLKIDPESNYDVSFLTLSFILLYFINYFLILL